MFLRQILRRRSWNGPAVLLVLALVIVSGQTGCSSSLKTTDGSLSTPGFARDEGVGSQYRLRLGTEDQLQFNVYVWGQVNKPGLYSVEDGTDLISLISLAGGPTDDAKLSEVVLVRGRSNPARSSRVDLQDFVSSGKYERIPVLQPGDTVIVPAKLTHTVFRFTGILSVAALIANVIVTAATR